MADKVTLLTITQRNSAIGPLIEENIVVAPTWDRVPVKTITGLTYNQRVRTELPHGGFNNVGDGYTSSAGAYTTRAFGLKHFGGVLKIPSADVEAERIQAGSDTNSILVDEQSGFVKGQMLDFDNQFFHGPASGVTGADVGYIGLDQLVDSTMSFGLATDTTGGWAYIVLEDTNEGCSWLMKDNSNIDMLPWEFKQDMLISVNPSTGAFTTGPGYISTCDGFIGMKVGTPSRAIAIIKGITKATPLTDKVIMAALSKFKPGYMPTSIYMSKFSRYLLTASRTPTQVMNGRGNLSGSGDFIAATATESNDIPIVISDNIGDALATPTAGEKTNLTNLI
jgi:hypothetical protein